MPVRGTCIHPTAPSHTAEINGYFSVYVCFCFPRSICSESDGPVGEVRWWHSFLKSLLVYGLKTIYTVNRALK